METSTLDIVTGAFGYTGKYITQRLLAAGQRVRTLTGRPDRPNPFGNQIEVAPFNFEHPGELIESLRGATTLFNTYWVRFPHGAVTYEKAIQNTTTLIRAAEEAGVRRIVHVSITSASTESPFPYFRGKGILEQTIMRSRLSYAIIRPTVIFGAEDILVNNLAWILRRFPVFTVPGNGDYRVQPIFVEDMADIAVRTAQERDNVIIDAVGPETFSFNELVRLIADQVGSRARVIHVPTGLALFLSRVIGSLVGDVMLTRDEAGGLMGNLLVSEGPPTGQKRLSDWLSENADRVGAEYASELRRHYR